MKKYKITSITLFIIWLLLITIAVSFQSCAKATVIKTLQIEGESYCTVQYMLKDSSTILKVRPANQCPKVLTKVPLKQIRKEPDIIFDDF